MPNHISVILLPDPESNTDAAARLVMDWLARRLPITLVVDLADPEGPDSRAIHAAESVAADVRRIDVRLPDAGPLRARVAGSDVIS